MPVLAIQVHFSGRTIKLKSRYCLHNPQGRQPDFRFSTGADRSHIAGSGDIMKHILARLCACLAAGMLAGCEVGVEAPPAATASAEASGEVESTTTAAEQAVQQAPQPRTMAASKGVARGYLQFVEGYRQGYNQAIGEAKPMLVFFTAPWCHFCHQMADEAFTHPQVVSLSEHFVCILVDVDVEPDVCRQFQVSGYPTIQFLSPEGAVLERMVGKQPGHLLMISMQAALQTIARRSYDAEATAR
jgi:thiol-disulfide isomerase/thioredoxin